MKASSKHVRYGISFLLMLAGVSLWLALPNLQSGHASGNSAPPVAARQTTALDGERRAALDKLLQAWKAGAPVSEEEASLLKRYAAGATLTELEADVLISRALYARYVQGIQLTREQSDLLSRYSQSVARHSSDVLDLKRQLLNQRIAAAAAGPRAPQVAPANDLCAGAEVIPASGPFPYSTATTADITDATTTGDPPVPSCQTDVSRSIWYSFTPSTSGIYTIATCSDAPTATTVDDTVMAIYTSSGGCAGPFTEVPSGGGFDGCDDDGCVTGALQSVITTQLNASTTYYIVVWQYSSTAPLAGHTAVQLRVSRILAQSNDTCAGATALSLFTPVDGTTVAAANDYQLSGSTCFTGVGQTASTAAGRDVVYSFTAPSADTYSFRVTNYDTDANLVLYAASSCPAGTPPVTVSTCLGAANRDSSSSSEEVMCLSLTNGQQVFIFVDENGLTDGSTFTIEATRCAREVEANNTPATANPFVFGIEGSINPAGDVDFFSLGTPATGSRIFAMIDAIAGNSSDFDMRVTTTTDTLEFDDFDNDTPFGQLAPNVAGTPTTGTPTYLRISHFSATGAFEPYRLYAVVQPPSAQATAESEPNNDAAHANSAANNYFSGALAGPAPSTDVDVYSFTASAGTLIFLSLDCDPTRDNTPIDGKLELLDGGSNVLVLVNDDGQTSSTTSGAGSLTSTTPNSPGEALVYRVRTSGTYYARVSIGTSSTMPVGAGDYLLSIFVSSPTAARFANDPAAAARATRYSDGALVRWQTGYEVENLGFNVYREEDGQRTRVNSQLIAGSALLVGPTTALGAGRSYSCFDAGATEGGQYWVEAIDLNGQSTWQGPISVARAPGRIRTLAESPALGEVGQPNFSEAQTTRVERRAAVKNVAAADIAVQSNLAGQSAAKLAVTTEGFYRVALSELAAAGFNTSGEARNLQLYVDGEQVPINVTNGSSGSMAIEFYGVGVESAVTVEHVYWLINAAEPGLRMRQTDAAASPSKGGSFLASAEFKPRTLYFASLRNGDADNFFGPIITNTLPAQVLSLQHVAEASSDAQLEVGLQGMTMVGHRVEVQLNGQRVGEIAFSEQNSGRARFQVAQSLLKEGANAVRLVPLGGPSDISLIDYLRINYWHALVADNNQLRFTAAAKQAVSVGGFSNPNVRVFDVTEPNAARELLGMVKKTKSGYSVSVKAPKGGERTLFAMADDSARHLSAITLNQPSNWRQKDQAADYVIITRGDMLSAFAPLAAWRQQQGYQVALINVEDLYDEFSYGQKTPQAIKDFLSYAAGNWQ
ncbi:MAG TPA: C25 family cysteine peptidase, partial [Blastocatellia bacterium]|nr:C25 family cysteine peptidase [Blastocatellia bacterium]